MRPRSALNHTSLPEPGHVSIGSDAAHGYELVNGKLCDVTDVDPSMVGAAGGNSLVTTTEDLARFIDALFTGKLFQQPETLDHASGPGFAPAKSPVLLFSSSCPGRGPPRAPPPT